MPGLKRYPPVPGVESAPSGFFDAGHLWIQELVAGELLRFQVQADGSIRFGARRRAFDAGDVPPRFEHATRAVRDELDVAVLRDAVADVESVVCFAVATQYAGVTYDWARLPSVLGIDVWDGEREAFLGVAECERTFEALGLEPVNALDREVRVRDYDVVAAEESMPASAWYDGPVAGVVLRQKTGERVSIPNSDVDLKQDAWTTPAIASSPAEPTAEAVAAATATTARFDRVATAVRERGHAVTFDALYDRVLASIYREHHHWLHDHGGASVDSGATVDLGAFRDAVAARTSEYLAD